MHLIGPISLHMMEDVSSQQYPPHCETSRGESSEKGTKYGGMCTICEAVCNKVGCTTPMVHLPQKHITLEVIF